MSNGRNQFRDETDINCFIHYKKKNMESFRILAINMDDRPDKWDSLLEHFHVPVEPDRTILFLSDF